MGNMGVNHVFKKFRELAHQVECLAEAALFTFLCRQDLRVSQVKVIIEREECDIFAMQHKSHGIVCLCKEMLSCLKPVNIRYDRELW